MYSSPNSRDASCTVATVLESTGSLDEIFCALGKYGLWDYLNYYLLQTIIEEFASDDDELKNMMEQYQRDLTGHVLTLQIETYLNAIHPNATSDSENSDEETVPAIPPQQRRELFKKLTCKIDTKITDHTLAYVSKVWESLSNQFALPRPAMILLRIAEGCLGITWLIPANLVKRVTRIAQKTTSMFAEQHILRMVLEEQCIYTETHLPEPEITLQEYDPSLEESDRPLLEAKPPLLETKPPLLETKPCIRETKPSVMKTKPSLLETVPHLMKTKPLLMETKSSAIGTEPSLLKVKPSLMEAEPPIMETKPPVMETKPSLLKTETAEPKRKVCCHIGICIGIILEIYRHYSNRTVEN